jgi:hypothetical protein
VDTVDQQAFDLGWDWATFGANVPETANKLFCDGYRAFAGDSRRKAKQPDKFVRKWLQIRFGAFSRGKPFAADVTPQFIAKIVPSSWRCPVIEEPFTFSSGEPTDWSIDRANNDRGYVRGNIIVISRYANTAKSDKSLAEIRLLSDGDHEVDGLIPGEWSKLARLIEPAFGDQFEDVNPTDMLIGQPLALGMPISPLAGFQVTLSRVILNGRDPRARDGIGKVIAAFERFVCRTKEQKRRYRKLVIEIIRRAGHVGTYWEIWATERVQKRLFSFVSVLGGSGLMRLSKLQEMTIGEHNTNTFL